MANPRGRGRPAKLNTQAEQLSKALDFISAATMDDENFAFKSHCKLGGNMALATTGQISAGHPIVEELDLCPHLERARQALLKCGKTLTLAQTPTGQLSVKGDKIRVLVPCVPVEEMPLLGPDQPIAAIDDKLKAAFKACGTLASEAGERVVEASLLLEANTCTGTNGYAMLQYWHGIDLPPHIVLPKAFTSAVAKVETPLTGFGFTWDDQLGKPASVTFWFEGGAWLKTMCYSDRWPDVDRILNIESYPIETLAGLYDAIEAVEKFSDDKTPNVFFAENKVMSHSSENAGAQYDVPGLQAGLRFNAKMFRQTKAFAATLDLTTHKDKALFFGDAENPVRGVIMGMAGGIASTTPAPEPSGTAWGGAEIAGDDGFEPDE